MTPTTTIEARKVTVTEPEQAALMPVSAAPADLLRIAVSQNADIATLERLMDLKERHERNEARKAYVQAMNDFKANPPAISKNKNVSFKDVKYSHATLDHVVDAVTKGLSQHGISHRWKVEQEKEWIKVTCILTHSMGHSEETVLQGVADTTGSKNSIQAIGSTVTYLQRYTLLAATGLAAANSDTDGRTAPATTAPLPGDKVLEQCEWISNARNLEELQRLFTNAYREAGQAKDRRAMDQFISAKDARKKELL